MPKSRVELFEYGFASFFSIPGMQGAHERGGGEGRVGRFRRRHLVRLPKVDTLAELNDLIALADAEDAARHMLGHQHSIGTESAAERPLLRPLPDKPLEMVLALNCRVDHKSRICVLQCFSSVPAPES